MRSHLSEERERSAWPYAAWLGGGRARAVRAGHRRIRRARHHRLDLGRHRRSPFCCSPASACSCSATPRRFRRARPPSLALALASIGGPGSLARSIAVSLGLGLGLLVAVALIHRSLLAEIASNIEVDAPAYYFLDVEGADLDGLPRTRCSAIEPDAKLDDAPMLRGRIVALNGVPAEKVEAAARFALGALRRPRADLHRHRAARSRRSSKANGGRRTTPARRSSPSMPSLPRVSA